MTIADGEEDGIDATVAQSAAFGPDLSGGSPDALAIGTGMTVPKAVSRFVLFYLINRDGHGIAIRVGHAPDGDFDERVIWRPDAGDAGSRTAAIGWSIGRREDIGRACVGPGGRVVKWGQFPGTTARYPTTNAGRIPVCVGFVAPRCSSRSAAAVGAV